MSSDGNNDLAHEYSAGAIADSPIPFSQENPDAASVRIPVTPVINFATMRPLSSEAPVFSPRPVTMLCFAKRCPTWTMMVWMQLLMTQLWSLDTRYSNTRSPLYVRRHSSTSTSIDK
jgi:hypothetical protein